MQNRTGKTATVIVPDKKEVPVGTLKSIIKRSGLDRSCFE